MVDPESVRRRLREIGRRLARLERVRQAGRDRFMAEPICRPSPSANSRQAAIDVAIHVLSEDSDETPEDYADAFVKLGRASLIENELAGRLARAAGFRNILVHAYLEVDPALVWTDLESLGDFRAFSESVERYLTR